MTDYTELLNRLRGVNWVCHTYGKTEIKHDTVCHEAADAIEALETDFHKQADMNGRLLTENAELRQRIAELEHHLRRAKKVLEPFAKQLAWKFGRYVGDLPIVAKSPHEEVKDEMTFKLYDFRMAHLIWEDIGKELGDKE